MKLAKTVLLLTAAFWGVLTFSDNVAAQNAGSHIISFDPPGSATVSVLGTGCFGCTFSINQFGAVVGTFIDSNFVFHGFLRTPDGKFTSLDATGADTLPFDFHGTFAQSINDLGVIVGHYSDANGLTHGFIRSAKGIFTTFDVPGAVNGSFPVYINDESVVTGYASDANLLIHAFVRQPNGTFSQFLGPNGCTSGSPNGCFGSEATSVGLLGTVFGNFQDNSANFVEHGLIREPSGKITAFEAPGAGNQPGQGTGCPGCNFGTNIWGWIAGTFTDANYVFHGFLRSPNGTFTTFEATGSGTNGFQGTGCFSDCPVGLNDLNVITGSYYDANNVQHGYVRSANGKFETIDPEGSTGTQPENINDGGIVVGYYQDANGVSHGFLSTPDFGK